MKAILLSIKPKYVKKILIGEKTIEIRKQMPKCDLPIDVYIYCTKDPTCELVNMEHYLFGNPENALRNGKVVAKFTLNSVEPINIHHYSFYQTYGVESIADDNVFYKKSCLITNQIEDYLCGKQGYAWHIDNLKIFDTPKRLTWFRGMKEDVDFVGKPYKKFLTRAPQSYCFIEVEE